MKIIKSDFVAGAQCAEGIAVIIDVFRAFSVACYCFAGGVKKIHPVGEVEQALILSNVIDDSILIGERKGKKLEGFNYGNSPTEILTAGLDGLTAIHTTHAGTQGLVNATTADQVLTGAFVNARATAQYIRAKKPQVVTLVRMGLEASESCDEDDLCADYLESLILNRPMDENEIISRLEASPYSQRFFDPEKPWNPQSDFDLCLDINRFDFVLCATRDTSGLLALGREDIVPS